MAQIEADAKVEMAKIRADAQIRVAKLNAKASREKRLEAEANSAAMSKLLIVVGLVAIPVAVVLSGVKVTR